MIAKAINKYVRRTPRKVNYVLETIRGKNVDYAFMLLKTLKQPAKEEVSKTLKSAVSNAENNHQLDIDKLFVKEATTGRSMVLKRFRPRAMGRASQIRKKNSHIFLKLIK